MTEAGKLSTADDAGDLIGAREAVDVRCIGQVADGTVGDPGGTPCGIGIAVVAGARIAGSVGARRVIGRVPAVGGKGRRHAHRAVHVAVNSPVVHVAHRARGVAGARVIEVHRVAAAGHVRNIIITVAEGARGVGVAPRRRVGAARRVVALSVVAACPTGDRGVRVRSSTQGRRQDRRLVHFGVGLIVKRRPVTVGHRIVVVDVPVIGWADCRDRVTITAHNDRVRGIEVGVVRRA